MSDKKQTAVEFLVEELKENGFSHLDLATDIIEQAKEMERQQIIDAKMPKNLFGQIDQQEAINEAEQYYNETFKKQ